MSERTLRRVPVTVVLAIALIALRFPSIVSTQLARFATPTAKVAFFLVIAAYVALVVLIAIGDNRARLIQAAVILYGLGTTVIALVRGGSLLEVTGAVNAFEARLELMRAPAVLVLLFLPPSAAWFRAPAATPDGEDPADPSTSR